ncbi:MAG: 3'-5' exonuclease, partial [Paracoccaceae bacterium]
MIPALLHVLISSSLEISRRQIVASVTVRFLGRRSDALDTIAGEVTAFEASDHKSLAIIARTQKDAAKLHDDLVARGFETRLLDATSTGLSTGAIVCTAHLAKGLEFDRVIIPDASAANYRTEMDRNLLYVACTRAMHRLTVVAV